MPAKPIWISRFAEVESQIASIQVHEVGRSTIESILGLKERRAQQLMVGLPGRTVGTSFLVDRDALLNRLRSIASGTENTFESDRRKRMAATIEGFRRERIEQPQLLVESPVSVVNTRIEQLPAGVTIAPGRITVSCDSATQALERLLALCMAIGNDPDKFSQLVEPS